MNLEELHFHLVPAIIAPVKSITGRFSDWKLQTPNMLKFLWSEVIKNQSENRPHDWPSFMMPELKYGKQKYLQHVTVIVYFHQKKWDKYLIFNRWGLRGKHMEKTKKSNSSIPNKWEKNKKYHKKKYLMEI